MHVHRTIALTEAAGFAAIEIEDQLLPRRVEHHIGIDNLVTTELMVDKVREAIAARTDSDLVIIARTNSRRVHDLDEALRRCEAFHRAGADMLFVHTRDAEEMRIVGERLPPPLMTFAPPDGFATFAMSTWPGSAIAWRPLRAPPSPPCTRRCANPWSASPTTGRTRSSAPAAPRRR